MNAEAPPKDHTTDALYRRLKGHARACSYSAGILLGMNLVLAISILRILFDLTDSGHEVLKNTGASEFWIMSSIRLAASVIIFAIMRTVHEMSRYHAYLADFYYSRAQGLSLAIASKKEEPEALEAYADAFMPPAYLYKLSAKFGRMSAVPEPRDEGKK